MAEPGAQTGAAALRYLTFWAAGRLYALPATDVSEVIRLPPVARVPMAAAALLGLVNLRGGVLPVASLRGLLGQQEQDATQASRVLVLGDGGSGLAVDAVGSLVAPDAVEAEPGALVSDPSEHLQGVFMAGQHSEPARVLDVARLLAAEFSIRPSRTAIRPAIAVAVAAQAATEWTRLLTFDIAGQVFALPLDCVREIIPLPAERTTVQGEALARGVIAYRDRLLPLLALRGLLGFAEASDLVPRVVVTAVGGALVGLIVDRIRDIVPLDPALEEPIPAVLAARVGGEARIRTIYRSPAGLVSVLAPELLFREDVMQRLDRLRPTISAEQPASQPALDQIFLVFRLGDDEFGLPIDVIDEVTAVPAQVTRVPKVPGFVAGVVNLRGEVLPVIDQRRRFGMAALTPCSGRRLVVVRTAMHRAGLIVDSVSDVLRVPAEAITPAPVLTFEETPLVHGVINLPDAGRMVLTLDPAELLTRAESRALSRFAATAQRQPA